MLNKVFYNLANARIACAQRFVSRASTATYIDPNGVLQTAGVNVPRYQGGALLIGSLTTTAKSLSINGFRLFAAK